MNLQNTIMKRTLRKLINLNIWGERFCERQNQIPIPSRVGSWETYSNKKSSKRIAFAT